MTRASNLRPAAQGQLAFLKRCMGSHIQAVFGLVVDRDVGSQLTEQSRNGWSRFMSPSGENHEPNVKGWTFGKCLRAVDL